MLKYNKTICTGCQICEVVCSLTHHGEINTGLARIRYADAWPKTGNVAVCRQCDARLCLKSCPEGALAVNRQSLIELNEETCTGCMKCSEACPFGTLPSHGKFPLFCDTCNSQYQCVVWCPVKALQKAGE